MGELIPFPRSVSDEEREAIAFLDDVLGRPLRAGDKARVASTVLMFDVPGQGEVWVRATTITGAMWRKGDGWERASI